ncbi:MAG: autotransporter domain-containing protein, partial [Fusobacterium periodonticum]|nr:autotransporter domain-containing protein [Fusobacterium periodonticum]
NTYKGSVVNSGTITSTGKATGITYNGTGSGTTDTRVTNDTAGKINLAGEGSVGIYGLGSNYHILNKGEITLGDSTNISTNPNVGIYTAVESVSIKNDTNGKIITGKESVGAYGYDIENAGDITVGDNGVGIYSKRKSTGPSTVTSTGNITVGNNDSTGIFLENGGNLNLTAGNLNVGDNSYGVVAIGNDSFNYNNNAAVNVSLGEGSTYFYSSNPTTNFTNNIALNTTNKRVYGISTAGTVTNSANFTLGDESVGILYTGTGTARNTANITVGNSDVDNQNYAIGMATKTGTVENAAGGTITVGSSGIGLFADGANAKAINNGTINLNGPGAMGMYLDNKAEGTNNGTIQVNGSQEGAIGVVVQNRAKLINNGTIAIDGKDAYAFFKAKGGTIENHGTINLSGGAKEQYDPTSKPTSKTTGSVVINAPAGATPATTSITVAGNPQTIEQVVVNTPQGKTGPAPTSLGIYVDTLGGTNPISGNLGLVTTEADLILGNEAAKTTTSKNIIVSGSVLDPYNAMMAANPGVTWSAYAGALTWTATPLYANGDLGSVVLAKIPYTEFAGNEATPVAVTDTYNFLDGLEQRYGVEPVGSREKAVFDKLNEIGKNEKALFYQATDEMMGHQYANV